MENSPLQKYRRQPKLYIDLPSRGQWYPKGDLEKSEELEVYSMTANDELAAKTPDALITGNAVVSIIQNCVPAIKNAWSVTNRDLDYILAAIRIASYGDSLNIGHTCTKCKNEDTYGIPLQGVLDHIATVELDYEFKVNDFVLRIRPINYKEIVSAQQESMKYRRFVAQVLDKIEDIDERTTKINEVYEKINEQTKHIICSIVTEIITPEGDSEKNPVFIRDFILNSEGSFFEAIEKAYIGNSQKLQPAATEVECSQCQNVDKVIPGLDYTSFFSKV